MKTDDFIKVLSEDQAMRTGVTRLSIRIIAASGLAFSLVIFFAFLGIRADFSYVIKDPHVVFKFIFAASVFGALLPLVKSLVRPEANARSFSHLILIPALVLGCGITFQLLTSPADYWIPGMEGRYPFSCLKSIPALAIGPLAVMMIYLREGAPTRPVLSGALAGCVAGGAAALIYAFHCPDDSALFVALWYSLAIAIVTMLGAVWGYYWLKW